MTAEGSCIWTTLDNDYNDSGFNTISSAPPPIIGETLTQVYLYFGSNVGASGMTIEIEEMSVTC